MKRVAFIYPGQGSQAIGMGKDFFETFDLAKDYFNRANNILGYNLQDIMFEGPNEELTKTENTQPALLLVSSIISELLKEHQITPEVAAGHSLGEYSALTATGAISFDEAIMLVHRRGKLMESAFPAGKGAMAAVLGLQQEEIQEVLNTITVNLSTTVEIANLNCPGQIVISGTRTAIDAAVTELKEAGAKRVLPLSVSGPFHSSLMRPAASKLEEEINECNWNDVTTPIYANVTATKVQNQSEIKQLLVEQLYSPVRFEEIITNLLAEELDAIVEVGSGKVLSGLVKKVNRRANVFSVQDIASFENFIAWMKEEN
ncbi:[acyl-carrier-protein] S-malonyltransferase [Gracilibacillus halotolerans]|uniref:Malonyl CoA-acyl carrier protein transacylase n=1 Tax=Gracilibacillus halotolerans TaxID=74386 RepID=A0A841RJN5_9BACI|nr:ACP S-malonyltransferase [Gracilibacillus halotolerans]MBB6511405.1 [acyl-carrier-protein] S-malonyltransferase [Gracilibacillus halotolerans]